jgi:hypothetical protein
LQIPQDCRLGGLRQCSTSEGFCPYCGEASSAPAPGVGGQSDLWLAACRPASLLALACSGLPSVELRARKTWASKRCSVRIVSDRLASRQAVLPACCVSIWRLGYSLVPCYIAELLYFYTVPYFVDWARQSNKQPASLAKTGRPPILPESVSRLELWARLDTKSRHLVVMYGGILAKRRSNPSRGADFCVGPLMDIVG